MALRLVGAGLGRTGTLSLKVALERLLGAPCYHMAEVLAHPEHVPVWDAAAHGRMPDWKALFEGYAAAVDWPVCSFWREIAEAFPGALIVLSTRDAESWWRSASETIFPVSGTAPQTEWREMIHALMANRFTSDFLDHDAAVAAFERHNAAVRATAPKERLLEWRPSDGWAPLCTALGLPAPDEPFPHVNTREDFAARLAETVRNRT